MSKVIEVVVIGATGTGKSNVLAVIDSALREAYDPHTQIASRDLSLERGLGSPSEKPSADTIFNLREQSSAIHSKSGELKVTIDASELTSTIDKLGAIQGEAMCFALDPLESAISSTIGLMNDHAVFLAESSLDDVQRAGVRFLGEKLNSHLNHLLSAQLKRVTADETI